MKFKILISIFAGLCLAILYFDFWIYKDFVFDIESKAKKGGPSAMFLLKTPMLEKAATEIRKKDAFLENPSYPLIKDPF